MQLFKLQNIWQRVSPSLLDIGIRSQSLRNWALRKGETELYHDFVTANDTNMPRKVLEMKYQVMSNLLHRIDQAIADGRISAQVRRSIIRTLIGSLVIEDKKRSIRFHEKHGYEPPTFIAISPTKKCNLHCKGCYANSSAKNAETLNYSVVQRIIREKTEEWGSHFTVITGGEPLLYKSEGKDLFDLLKENRDNYFLMYTNSTLINTDVAKKMAQIGNITPAISVEGWEKETDARRGKGMFSRILQAMENLRSAGVPFGISVTATRENAEVLLSDDFIDFFFNKQGAVYGWLFQYMPIDGNCNLDLMITPEQRRWMLNKQLDLIYEKKLFYIDFWNGGPLTVGCIAAGRPGGYFHIDWNGSIAPCVFFPYYIDNINDIYRNNRRLIDVMESKFFRAIRDWQNDYAYERPPEEMKSLFTPCPIRDHYKFSHSLIKSYSAKPKDEEAGKVLLNEEYKRKMIVANEQVCKLLDPVWEREVIEPEHRIDKGKVKAAS